MKDLYTISIMIVFVGAFLRSIWMVSSNLLGGIKGVKKTMKSDIDAVRSKGFRSLFRNFVTHTQSSLWSIAEDMKERLLSIFYGIVLVLLLVAIIKAFKYVWYM